MLFVLTTWGRSESFPSTSIANDFSLVEVDLLTSPPPDPEAVSDLSGTGDVFTSSAMMDDAMRL